MAGVLGKLVVSVVGDYRDLEKSLKLAQGKIMGFNKSIDGISKSFVNVGKSATKYVTLPIMAALTGLITVGGISIKLAADLEESMRNVNTVMRVSEDQLATITDEILTMSKELPQSAKILAEGLYDIAGSGFVGAEAMMVLEASAKAASAGVTDTAISARGIVAVLNAYGLSAKDAEAVSDAMFATVDKGVITFAEVAGSIGDVVSTAKIAGVKFNELSGFIAYLTIKGIGAAEATTSLNRQILSIINPSEELAKVFKDGGYETGELALKELGLLGVMELVNEAAGGSITKMQQLFPEMRAMKGANAELSSGYEDLSNFMEGFVDVSGSTEEALKEQSKGFKFQLQILKNNMTAIGIELGQKLLPIVSSVVEAFKTKFIPAIDDLMVKIEPLIAKLVDATPALIDLALKGITFLVEKISLLIDFFTDLDPKWSKFILKAIAFAAAFGPIMIIIGKLIPAFKLLGVVLKVIIAPMAAIAKVIAIFAKLKAAIIAVVAVVTTPIGLIVAAIAALIAIGYLVWKNWDTIKAKAIEIWGAIRNFLVNLWVTIGEKAIGIWNSIKEFFVNLWDSIKTKITESWEAIIEWITGMWERIKEIFVTAGKDIWAWMLDWIPFLNIIVENWDEFIAWLKEGWDKILKIFIEKGTDIKTKTIKIWNSIRDFFKKIWNAIYNFLKPKIDAIRGYIKNRFEDIRNFFIKTWEKVKTTFNSALKSIKNVISTAFNFMKNNVIIPVWNSIKNFFSNTWNSIVGKLNSFKNSFLNVWNRIKDGLKSPINAMIGLINSFLSKIAKGVNSMIGRLGKIMPGLKGLKISIPKIPKLALGGTITEPGFVDVGERGRERIFLPKGAEVRPLEKIAATYQTIHIHNEYNEELASKTFARLFAQYVGVINK